MTKVWLRLRGYRELVRWGPLFGWVRYPCKQDPVWTLDEALTIVREIQPALRLLGYHATLGGGVVNIGHSRKDLDLFILSLDNPNEARPSPGRVMLFLGARFGDWSALGEGYTKMLPGPWSFKCKFPNNGKRIDVFVSK